jgi:NAD(P)-dependent dehydrogenase (short-subunit alcohol dehydrogenase family)
LSDPAESIRARHRERKAGRAVSVRMPARRVKIGFARGKSTAKMGRLGLKRQSAGRNGMAATYSDLAGKTVLVTGGGSGIGEAIVRQFARQKSKVGFLDIAREASERLAAELSGQGHTVRFEHADLTDIAALRAAVQRVRESFGPITVLVNNAAHDERHATPEVTPEYWDDRIAVNLKHQFFAAQAVLPDMQAAQEGVIINFGSVSWMVGQGGMAAYTSSKSAVLGLTRSLARDFGPDNVRVVAIAPGWTMTQRQIEHWLTPESEAELMKRQCLKRRIMPDEVAKFTVFMASEEASACTNQHFVVDGGWV